MREIIDKKIKAKTIKLLEKNKKDYVCNPRTDKDFLGHKKH